MTVTSVATVTVINTVTEWELQDCMTWTVIVSTDATVTTITLSQE